MIAPPNLCNGVITLPSSDALSRDSVDGARTGANICVFRNYHNAEACYGRLPTPRIAGAERLQPKGYFGPAQHSTAIQKLNDVWFELFWLIVRKKEALEAKGVAVGRSPTETAKLAVETLGARA